MNCPRTISELHAYLDGELSATESVAFEQHLVSCDACRAILADDKQLREAMSNGGLYHRAPTQLIERIEALIPADVNHSGQALLQLRSSRNLHRRWWTIGITSMAAAAIAACLVIVIVAIQSRGNGDNLLAQEIVSSHVRSMMVDHLLDVRSTDRHTVKPWFDGKLDFAPPVKDTTAQGFPLIGGRLDYIGDRPVASLVYKRQQHLINLFIWTSGQTSDDNDRLLTRQGYNLVRWTHAGMAFWAVSDLELSQLQQFAQVIQTAE
ncbi:MAG: anti-sigma factor [Phycisphaerae bacterium]|nr:anti-sigma factor [Phycisphaerae bacterium]